MNRSVLITGCNLLLVLPWSGWYVENPVGMGEGSFRYPVVVMETSLGDIKFVLYRDRAPTTVRNFLQYVEDGFYDGLIFHRAIRGFIIQGGGYDENLVLRQPRDPIPNEADNGLKNRKYTLAMARTNIVDSARSQFFINMINNSGLDYRDDTSYGFGYCVFGRVIEGMDVVDAISEVETGTVGDFHDVPVEPVIIIRAYRKR